MVSHAIQDLDASKATGPDRIPAIVLKLCSPELSPVLRNLYNKCLTDFCFPSCWKSSSVVPVLKKDGERSDPVMLLPSAYSTSIAIGTVPLTLRISYLPNVSLLEAFAFLRRYIVM